LAAQAGDALPPQPSVAPRPTATMEGGARVTERGSSDNETYAPGWEVPVLGPNEFGPLSPLARLRCPATVREILIAL
jgi:hypothetical protein